MSGPLIACDTDADRAYVAWRIIDCCLREDVHGIVSKGRHATPPASVLQAWVVQTWEISDTPSTWWRVDHWPAGVLWLPVRNNDSMQTLSAVSDGWIQQRNDGDLLEYGAQRWLEVICQGLDEETQDLHRRYAEEAACAASHRALAREAYAFSSEALRKGLNSST